MMFKCYLSYFSFMLCASGHRTHSDLFGVDIYEFRADIS